VKKILPLLCSLMFSPVRAGLPPTNTATGPRHEPVVVATVKTIGKDAIGKTGSQISIYPTCVRVEPDAAYLGPDRGERADLFWPLQMPADKHLPAVIIIHGGGFNDGDKARPREINIATNLVVNGYICLSINYRLCRRQGDVTWPQPVSDAKAAVRWLRKNAARLQLDPDRIGVIGCSAGGHLAAMLALTRPEDGFDLKEPYGEFSSAVNCAVDFYGPAKLLDYHDMRMFGKTRAEAPALYAQASPVNYASAGDAPILVVHGTKDETVPLAQSEALVAALKQAGVEHEFIVVTNAPHTFNLMPPQQDLRPVVLGFLDKYLKSPANQASDLAK
jgi:acetyl esterase/lipase